MMIAWEDFVAGSTIDLGTVTVDEAEMLDFNRRFDPQSFHVDAEAAAQSVFGGLIASGWYTCALFMRLWVDSVVGDSTSQGSPGMSELRWLSPVRAGDTLAGVVHVLDTYPSQHNPKRGTVMVRAEMIREGEVVMRCEFRALFGRQTPAA